MAEIHSVQTGEGTGVRYIDDTSEVGGTTLVSYFEVRIGPLTEAEARLAAEVAKIARRNANEDRPPLTQDPLIIGGRRVENAGSVDDYSGPAALALKSAGVTN